MPQKVTPAALGSSLRKAREAKNLTLSETAYRLRDHVPKGFHRTGEAIRQWEKGNNLDLDDAAALIVLLALSKVYDEDLVHLTDEDHAKLAILDDLIRSRSFQLGQAGGIILAFPVPASGRPLIERRQNRVDYQTITRFDLVA